MINTRPRSQEIIFNQDGLDVEIFQLLSENADAWLTIQNLYNKYVETREDFADKKSFIISCELLNTRFNNIRKCKKRNGLCYLAFVTDKDKELNYPKDIVSFDDKDNDEEFKRIKDSEVIEYMLQNPESCYKLPIKSLYNNTDTVLHIICKDGKDDLLEDILNYYDVDTEIKNKEGLTPLEVINFEKNPKNSIKMVKQLLNYKIKNIVLDNEVKLSKTKEVNSALLKLNSDLTKENTRLKTKYRPQKSYSLDAFSIIFLMSVICIFYSSFYKED